MKNAIKSAALILGIGIATIANAQNDPSYSIHNYKHPNKAAKMKAIADAKPEVYLEEVKQEGNKADNSLTASSNYKGMSAEKSHIKTFKVSDKASAKPFFLGASVNRNYKNQFPARTKTVTIPMNRPAKESLAVN
jgi:hypothetical protein